MSHTKVGIFYISTLLSISLILYLFCLPVSAKNFDLSIKQINDKINSIDKYQAKLVARIYPPSASNSSSEISDEFDHDRFMEISSQVFGESGKKISIQTYSKAPDVDLEIESKLIYDGTWLWVEQIVSKLREMKTDEPKISAMKIYIPKVSPDPINEPFNTIYGQTGTGLFRYTDLPGTLKTLIEEYTFTKSQKSEKTDIITYSGYKLKSKKRKDEGSAKKNYDQEIKDLVDQSTKFCKLWISKKSGLIKAYSIGRSDDITSIHTEIEYISINQKLPDDIFIYKPPDGIEVRDATTSVLQKAKKMDRQ